MWSGEILDEAIGYTDLNANPSTDSLWIRSEWLGVSGNMGNDALDSSAAFRARWGVFELMVASEPSLLPLAPAKDHEAEGFKFLADKCLSSTAAHSVARQICVQVSEIQRWAEMGGHRWCLEALKPSSLPLPKSLPLSSDEYERLYRARLAKYRREQRAPKDLDDEEWRKDVGCPRDLLRHFQRTLKTDAERKRGRPKKAPD